MARAKLKRRWQPLTLVPDRVPEVIPEVAFCGHCGEPPQPGSDSRVCESCQLGLMLTAAADVAPSPRGAFVVIDSSMSVCAVSAAAESLLATHEIDAVNRHLTELIVPADAETTVAQNLAVAITWAARGDEGARTVTVRPANTFGVRLRTRIATCGPQQAALLVFD
jgi:hypothetical protein